MEEDKGKGLPPELSDVIAQVYQRYHDYLVSYAQQRGLSKYTAEDMVHETFLRICENPEKLLASRKESSWLLGILKHRIEHLQRDLQYAEQLKEELTIRSSDQYEDQLALRLIYGGIISEKELDMLVMYGAEGFTYDDLCAKYSLEEPTCRKQIERARKRIRKALGEDKNDD